MYGDPRHLHVLNHPFPTRRSADLARLGGDQRQQDEPQLAAVEHPAPAATFVPVVAESSAAAVTRPETMTESAPAPAHSLVYSMAFLMALTAAVPLGSISHIKLLHANFDSSKIYLETIFARGNIFPRGTFANFRRKS